MARLKLLSSGKDATSSVLMSIILPPLDFVIWSIPSCIPSQICNVAVTFLNSVCHIDRKHDTIQQQILLSLNVKWRKGPGYLHLLNQIGRFELCLRNVSLRSIERHWKKKLLICSFKERTLVRQVVYLTDTSIWLLPFVGHIFSSSKNVMMKIRPATISCSALPWNPHLVL